MFSLLATVSPYLILHTNSYVKHCHQEYQKTYDVCDRDFWMRSEEAVAFGVIDEILGVKD